MTRKLTDQPPKRGPSVITRWHEAGIAAMNAERLKHESEARYYRAEIERLNYEKMERETWSRARRVYDFPHEVTSESAAELIEVLSDWAHESDDTITLRLFSPGGDVVSGLAIYDFVLGIRAGGTRVDTLTLGWAASMASVIMQCGQRRLMASNAFVLIHEERTTYDTEWTEKITDMEDRLRFGWMLEQRNDAIIAERSTLTVEELRVRYARKDWWLGADECVELGFADAIWKPRKKRA